MSVVHSAEMIKVGQEAFPFYASFIVESVNCGAVEEVTVLFYCPGCGLLKQCARPPWEDLLPGGELGVA